MCDCTNDDDCECGCQEDTVVLQLDEGDVECSVIATFPVGDKDYIALLPTKSVEGYDEGEVFLYRYETVGEDELNLIDIEDEEEFEIVGDAFDQLLDEMEFNEIDEE